MKYKANEYNKCEHQTALSYFIVTVLDLITYRKNKPRYDLVKSSVQLFVTIR